MAHMTSTIARLRDGACDDLFSDPTIEQLREVEEDWLPRRERRRVWMQSFIFTLAIAVAALMFIEPLFDPTSRLASLRRRLTTGRYAIMAVWVGAVFAKPHFIAMPLVPFLILLLAISLLAAALPWLLAGKWADSGV